MTDKKENYWIKFVPSLNLPKERVSIAYDKHDERGVRYAYGYFQFYNGTCGCFLKDGNERPKIVKAEDIKYWMPVPSLDVQEEPVTVWHDASEEPKPNMELICVGQYGNPLVLSSNSDSFKSRDISKWAYFNDLLNLSNVQGTVKDWKEPVTEDLDEAAEKYAHEAYSHPVDRNIGKADFIVGANWQRKHLWKPADGDELKDETNDM